MGCLKNLLDVDEEEKALSISLEEEESNKLVLSSSGDPCRPRGLAPTGMSSILTKDEKILENLTAGFDSRLGQPVNLLLSSCLPTSHACS